MHREDKYEKILSALNQQRWISQRMLAVQTKLSLGTVNGCLRELTEQRYINKKEQGYQLTGQGDRYLERLRRLRQEQKLVLNGADSQIREAVILAAGETTAFEEPEGLLKIGDATVIERILRLLHKKGIETIYMVVGAKEEKYREYLRDPSIHYIRNEKYHWTGTMYSLSLASPFVKGDFLLIESNQIFEESALDAILKSENANAIVMTVPSGSHDEAYAELDSDQTIFRISKDVRQLNHIDGEVVGISRITGRLFERMMDYYGENTNPMLNYEYVLEAIGRIYGIRGIMVNDLLWSVIESDDHYRRVKNWLYPRILKRETDVKEERARAILMQCMNLAENDIGSVRLGGGMTNTNFFVQVKDEKYILRIPGAGTEHMVERKREYVNSRIGEELGLNPETLYFDPESGIKVTRCIPGAVTLNGKTARLENSIRHTTQLMHILHDSRVELEGIFAVEQEYAAYKQVIRDKALQPYQGFWEMDKRFYELRHRLDIVGLEQRPCHNDLVPENFVMSDSGRFYLIDWEYAGYNDPMWDVAAHLLECEFEEDETELFLQYYFPNGVKAGCREKILIFQILQDILWSAWTLLKESEGENFGTYGRDRLNRAGQLDERYRRLYGNE